MENHIGHSPFRCHASDTFQAVASFLDSGAEDGIIDITPSDTYRFKQPAAARRELTSLTIRVVRVILPNGEPAVYLTDLLPPLPSRARTLLIFTAVAGKWKPTIETKRLIDS